MNGKDSFKRCRKCGKMIGIIRERAYRKIIVDADPVDVFPDNLGETFIRYDGSKMRGTQATRYDDDRVVAEIVWRPHRCGVNPDEV